MDIIKLAGIAIIGVSASILLKDKGKEYSVIIGVITAVIILISAITAFAPVIQFINNIAGQISGSGEYIAIMLKCIGICYICSFAQDLCEENGEKTLASGIELAGRAAVMLLCLPMIKKLAEMAFGMINM